MKPPRSDGLKAVSSFLVRDAAFALVRVNQTYTPLNQAVSEIGLHQLEQELTALELFADLREGDADPATIAARRARLVERGGRVDAALARALRLLAAASQDPRYGDDVADLVRLEGMVASIDREHQDFEREILRIADLLQAADGARRAGAARRLASAGGAVQRRARARDRRDLGLRRGGRRGRAGGRARGCTAPTSCSPQSRRSPVCCWRP